MKRRQSVTNREINRVVLVLDQIVDCTKGTATTIHRNPETGRETSRETQPLPKLPVKTRTARKPKSRRPKSA